MTQALSINHLGLVEDILTEGDRARLLQGKVLLNTHPHSAWGAGVISRMYLSQPVEKIWQQVTTYSRWTEYFPHITHSEELPQPQGHPEKRLYQAARKDFLLLKMEVEVYLRVREVVQPNRTHQVWFRLERGNFADFNANLRLEPLEGGTLLTYEVQATPTIPVPSVLLQEAIRIDLPANLQKMRQALLG